MESKALPLHLPRCGLALKAAAALAGVALCAGVAAQEYPTRLVRLIIPFPPGGTTDNVARAVSDRLTKSLGQQVIIENRGGAGGMIGAKAVTAATPDGYTLLFGASSLAVGLGFETKDPYDPLDDLAAVSMVAEVTLALAVSAVLSRPTMLIGVKSPTL